VRAQSHSVAHTFDWLYSEEHRHRMERWVVAAGIFGFLLHLNLVFLTRHMATPPGWVASAGTNYLAAISTPFGFILFYEVLGLIAALPESTTRSIAMQFEIVSLIFIRSFFKHLTALDLEHVQPPFHELGPILLEVSAGLLMFLLVTVFRRAAPSRLPETHETESRRQILRLIQQKKFIALALTGVLVALVAVSVRDYVLLSTPVSFYADIFQAMIFADVLVLILSLVVSNRYELVFRNAAFVISTVLVRMSLTVAPPYGAALGVIGMLFGIVTVLIYRYNTQLTAGAHPAPVALPCEE
jgi:hypothetical protein